SRLSLPHFPQRMRSHFFGLRFQQRLGVLEFGGFETPGEPGIDLSEHRVGLLPLLLPGEARAQARSFHAAPPFRTLIGGDLDSFSILLLRDSQVSAGPSLFPLGATMRFRTRTTRSKLCIGAACGAELEGLVRRPVSMASPNLPYPAAADGSRLIDRSS